jgi:hypothetical protein
MANTGIFGDDPDAAHESLAARVAALHIDGLRRGGFERK